MKLVPMKYDYVFKKIFADSEDLSILTAFLSSYFEIPYEKLEGKVILLQGEIPKDHPYEKGMRVDLLVLLPNKEEVNIEMNNYNPGVERNLGYLCSIYGKQFKQGKYGVARKCIQINFNCYPNDGEAIEVYKIKNEKGKELTKSFEIHQINVEKCQRICYNVVNKDMTKERWGMLMLLDNLDLFKIELEKMDIPKEVKKRLFVKIQEVSETAPALVCYQEGKEEYERGHAEAMGKEKGLKEGMEKGLKQGLEKGEKKAKLELARKLKETGMDDDKILELTGLEKIEIL